MAYRQVSVSSAVVNRRRGKAPNTKCREGGGGRSPPRQGKMNKPFHLDRVKSGYMHVFVHAFRLLVPRSRLVTVRGTNGPGVLLALCSDR